VSGLPRFQGASAPPTESDLGQVSRAGPQGAYDEAEHRLSAHQETTSSARQTRTLRSEWHFLGELARPWRAWLALGSVCLLAESALQLTMPWFAAQFVRVLLQHQPPTMLLAAWLGVVTLQTCVSIGRSQLLGRIGSRMTAELTNAVYDHVQSLPLHWHQHLSRGEVLALLLSDVYQVNSFLTGVAVPVVPLLLTAAGALFLMLQIEPGLTWLVAIAAPVLTVLVKLLTRELRPLGRAALQARASRHALVAQNLAVLPMIKAFTREAQESQHHRQRTASVLDLELHMVGARSLITPLVRWLIAVTVLACVWVGATRVTSGALTTPALVRLLTYGLLMAQSLSQLAGVWGQVQQGRGAVQRLMATLAHAPEPDWGRQVLPQVRGDIRFENVQFSYPGRTPILNALDFHVLAGETVALTGPNGAGKSTLVHLLLRFADPDRGRILLDGVDVRELQLRDLRSHIGLVSQHTLLMNGSVLDNIRYGREDASEAQIAAAARAARADEFIRGLPRGYETRIGDDGLRLSGGQRQRLALARALLKDPAILILDEATSMFDPDGEQEVIAQCRELLSAQTVLLITHRPASLALADRVILVRDGQAVESSKASG